MKHPKRYCTKCDQNEYLTVRQGKKAAMYHCRRCGEEVCRVGDGDATRKETYAITELARMDPDILSDENILWPARSHEGELEREENLALLYQALDCLTPRQREVAEAVTKTGSAVEAAVLLRLSPSSIRNTLAQVKKKLTESLDVSDKTGLL